MNAPQSLSDEQRGLIHDLALDARQLLTKEARELLEGVYGLYGDGRLEPATKLPQVQSDSETAETYRRLAQFLHDETAAGLPPREAVDKLVKEVAFTHLNRLVAFKMMEARKLIRGTLDRGHNSNGFKFYLTEPEHADDLVYFQRGEIATAYRHFLLWQADQVAKEVRILFDPDALTSRLFPRPRALDELLALLNQPKLISAWEADETIGWVYQYFNEQEKAEIFYRLNKQKQELSRQDIPAATQLFTPNWIVRYLVQNTLGRLWVQMHPNTCLLGSELLNYLVPLTGEIPLERLRPIREIHLLDPACGAMHFGLVAFDLFAAMYQEELDRAGEPGWLVIPSVKSREEIAAAILAHNIYGIDIDLRAVQLAALALYLKAKSLNKRVQIVESHLACADILPGNSAKLAAFIREMRFTRPIYERIMRKLWEKLEDANQLGSLLRLETELSTLIETERASFTSPTLFRQVDETFEPEAAEQEFWHLIEAQIIQGLDAFARKQAQHGTDLRFFTGEATKGLQLLDIMLGKYDLVVTNPPYSGKRNLNDTVGDYLDSAYPTGKGDLYAAFIQRCSEFLEDNGYLGMITQQSFMFLSSYEHLRTYLRSHYVIETMAHLGPRAFAEISGEKVNTTAFVLRGETVADRREQGVGTYFRLIYAGEGDAKRLVFEQALQNGSNIFTVTQQRFDAILCSPWVYWIGEGIRALFEKMLKLGEVAQPRVGTQTGNNTRFLRFWWEVGANSVGFGCQTWQEAYDTNKVWFPYMKGGQFNKWYGNQEYVVNWRNNAAEIEALKPASVIRNPDFYFREGITWTDLGASGFSARISPGGFLFDVSGSCAFPETREKISDLLAILNTDVSGYLLSLLNPTMHFQVGDLSRLPICTISTNSSRDLVRNCIQIKKVDAASDEVTYDFVVPLLWSDIVSQKINSESRLIDSEIQIDKEVSKIYGLTDQDLDFIKAELLGNRLIDDASDEERAENNNDESNYEPLDATVTKDKFAVCWISYAIGIILGRFRPGFPGELGCAIYHKIDFEVGSLPKPNDEEFDELVGSPERFAHVDSDGGRHVFCTTIEHALCALAVPDGIAVLDEGHPCDLPMLVEQALQLMLGEASTRKIIAQATNADLSGDLKVALRNFLERDFFTKWHMKWYRKRPVYWPLQSAKRSYGFVLFHEKLDLYTLYHLQRDYLDHKLNGLELQINDLTKLLEGKSGRERKHLERAIDKLRQTFEEVNEFATTIARLVQEGYEPAPNWIDDGIILRMAPLWELIPIWKTEPKKYWGQLQAGDYDWAHIALHYRPDQVREKCRTNKSYAIAHGHEEWFEGN